MVVLNESAACFGEVSCYVLYINLYVVGPNKAVDGDLCTQEDDSGK